MSIYIYNIATEVPGGIFNQTMQSRLTLLIARDIETKLSRLQVLQGNLRLIFASSLTSEEKLILDGGSQAPAGGLIAAATHKIVLKVDGVVKTDNKRLDIPADRITFKTITLQKQKWNGNLAPSKSEIVAIESSNIGAISTLDGQLDENGEFSLILGPDVRRGSLALTVGVEFFAPLTLGVRFY